MRHQVRLGLIFVAGLLAVAVVVVAVEIQLALIKPRLEDEAGIRPYAVVVNGPIPAGAPDPRRIVWLGDSTTTGVGTSSFKTSMPYLLAEAEADAAGKPVELTVLGHSGDQVHEVIDKQLSELAETHPDVVYVSVGGNDVTAFTRRSTFRQRYERMLDGIAAAVPDAEVVLVGVPDMGSVARLDQPLRAIAGWKGNNLDDEIKAAADARGIVHVDVATATGPAFREAPHVYLARDLFHPSDAGYGLWVKAILDTVDGR